MGAGLLLRTLTRLGHVDPGFEPGGTLLATIDMARQGYAPDAAARAFDRLLEEMRAEPGVREAALAFAVPVQPWGMRLTVVPDGLRAAPGEPPINVDLNVVSPGYFTALGAPISRGRDFGPADREGAPAVAIVNQAFVDRFWPGQDPIGKKIGRWNPAEEPWTVVGLVPEFKVRSLRAPGVPVMHVPLAQNYEPLMTILVRPESDPAMVEPALRKVVARLDPGLPLFRVTPLRSKLSAAAGQERLLASLLGAFGVLAVVLAAAGLYGLVAFTTQARTREFGVRVALGARPADVVRLVLAQGTRLTAAGLALGLAASLGAARILTSFLFEVSPADAPTFAGAAAVLTAASLAASHLPARRAARADPMAALRHE